MDWGLPAVHQDIFPFSVIKLLSGSSHPEIFAVPWGKFPVLGKYMVDCLSSVVFDLRISLSWLLCVLLPAQQRRNWCGSHRTDGDGIMSPSEMSSPLTWNDRQKDKRCVSMVSHGYICGFICYNSCSHLFMDSAIMTAIWIKEAG